MSNIHVNQRGGYEFSILRGGRVCWIPFRTLQPSLLDETQLEPKATKNLGYLQNIKTFAIVPPSLIFLGLKED